MKGWGRNLCTIFYLYFFLENCLIDLNIYSMFKEFIRHYEHILAHQHYERINLLLVCGWLIDWISDSKIIGLTGVISL